MNRQDRLRRRWAMRPTGAVLLLAAYAAARHLLTLEAGRAGDPPPLAYLLALLVFLGFSAGCALLACGPHLFDPVEIAGRWRHQRSAPPPR